MPDNSGENYEVYRNRSAAGGVDTFRFALDIDDAQAVDLTNIDASSPGVRKVRSGMSLIATGITWGPVLALQEFVPSSYNAELLAISPGATYPNAAHLRLWKWGGTSSQWTLVGSLTGFTSATLPVEMVPGLDLNASGGPSVVRIITKDTANHAYVYNGSALALCSGITGCMGAQGAFPSAYMLNRGFAAGRTSASRGKVYYSDAGSYTVTGWATVGQSVTMGGGNRQEIVCIKPFRQSDLVVYLADRIEALQITESPLSLPTGTANGWSRLVIDTTIGCGSRRSVVTVGEDQFFVDQYGNVRSLARTITDNAQGTKTLPVSAPIQSWIDRINPAALEAICAVAYDRYYIVGFPIDSATSASHTFVYDRINSAWVGPWTGLWQPNAMAVATLNAATQSSDKNPTLFLGSATTTGGLVYRTFNGTTDAGSPIAMQETSKRYALGEIEADKFFRRIKDYYVASGTATMMVEARKNGESWQLVEGGYIGLSGDYPQLPQTLPFTLGGAGIVEKTLTLEDFEQARDLQLRFTCTASVDVQHLGYSLMVHRKNIAWDLGP